MKILFENVLASESINSVNQIPNYPAQNLVSKFLELRYEVAGTSDTVTVDFGSPTDIDCVFLGYLNNITDIDLDLKVGAVSNAIDFSSYSNEGAVFRDFTVISGVTTIELNLQGLNPFFAGGLAMGKAVDMPPATVQWEDSFQDNSSVTVSPYGQVNAQYIKPLRQFVFTFESVSYNRFLFLKEQFAKVGSNPVWVVFFEESQSDYPPGYYRVRMQGQRRNRLVYEFSVVFTEAR